MSRRADRLFELIQLLRRGRVITALDLARELEVSERTIYRDVQALVLAGVPVEGEAGIGYILRQGYELPPLMFTLEEAKALALGVRMVIAWGDNELQKSAQSVLDKVSTVVTSEVKEGLEDQTLAVPAFHVPQEIRDTLATLREGANTHRKVRFHYTRNDGDNRTRTARPLGLFYWGRSWTLASWCEYRKGFRNFRIDRMNEVRLLKSEFKPEAGRTLDDYLKSVETE
jgi:predicted DNA-binding transcriptional regulator YafY